MQKFGFVFSVISLCLVVLSCKKENVEDKLSIIDIDTIATNQFDQMVLLEPFTSTTCGACPIAHHEIERIEEVNNNIIHFTHYLSGPLNHAYTNYVIEKVNKTLYTPLSFIQRDNGDLGVVYYVIDRLEEIIDGELGRQADIGLSVETTIIEQDLSVDVKINTKPDAMIEDLAITVLIVENSVIGTGQGYDQRNYGHSDQNHPYYNRGEYIEGFEHTNVIRYVISSFDGSIIEIEGNEANWTGSFDTDNLPKDIAAYSIIAFASESANVGSPILNATLIGF